VDSYTIDAVLFKDMIMTSAALLDRNKTILNDLNVFPVPDGDTGTNMSMTMMAAARELSGRDYNSMDKAAADVSMGALRGARGNSGVILSQVFRGFSKGAAGHGKMDTKTFAAALSAGSEAAYKAVMKPKEGTMLTVIREVSKKAMELAEENVDIYTMMEAIIEKGEETLSKTPQMLPVLKEAGVVDAGGMGLLFIIKGFSLAINGQEITDYVVDTQAKPQILEHSAAAHDMQDIEFGYCTEFFIKNLPQGFSEGDLEKLQEKLARIGDSIVVVGDQDLVKVHVHTDAPGVALQHALKLGQLSGVKIDNMREQHANLAHGAMEHSHQPKPAEDKDYALVAVAAGDGISELFKDLMADEVVQGGQTMNPSAEDIRQAIERAPSRRVFVFPNNKNIVLAAQQAAEMTDKEVWVIPSRSIPQGITSILAFNPAADPEENSDAMNKALSTVKTGQIAAAVRDSKVNGFDISQGDYMGMLDGDITVVDQSLTSVAFQLLDSMMDQSTDVVTIFYGEDVEKQDAEDLVLQIEEKHPMCEVSLFHGGQPVYAYIFSAE
jgi:DAK2 domain fusion protein YloV